MRRRNSNRYAPSWPVMPVVRAVFIKGKLLKILIEQKIRN
jgi:hypothetical protein